MPTQPKVGRGQYHVYVKTHTGTPTAFAAGDKATGITNVSNQVSQNEVEADAYDYAAAVKLAGATNITLNYSQYFDPADVHLIRVFNAFKSGIDTPASPTYVDVLVVNGDLPAAGAKNFYTAGTYRVLQGPFGEGGTADAMSSPIQLALADGASLIVNRDLTAVTSITL